MQIDIFLITFVGGMMMEKETLEEIQNPIRTTQK